MKLKSYNEFVNEKLNHINEEHWYEQDYSSWTLDHLEDHLDKLNQSVDNFFGDEPNPNYHDRGYQDLVEERNEVEEEINKRKNANESIKVTDPDDIQQGDLVDFGPYGDLYVCNPYYSDTHFWVTDDEEERKNTAALGWTIHKSDAKNVIEPIEEVENGY